MSDTSTEIKAVVVKVATNKPVRKTPYQVKGVLMRKYSDEKIVPMLDGSYREKYLYPRVQVKILNEQIYIVGIKEGVNPVIELCDKFKLLDFGNITFEVNECDVEESNHQFRPSNNLVRYRFITPWVALNHMTGGKYRFLTNQEKPSYLNRLLGQNIIFIANEIGINFEKKIYTKVKVSSLFPKPVDEKKWGAFIGEFKTNFVLPNYIGIGNGITRGYGSIYGLFNPKSFSFNEERLAKDISSTSYQEDLESRDDLESISLSDVPKPKRKRLLKKKNKSKSRPRVKKPINKNHQKTDNKGSIKKKIRHRSKKQNKNLSKDRKVLFEEFIIEDDNGSAGKNSNKNDDQKFNSEKYHKRQHRF